MSNQVYGIITERILKMLEQGTVPWRKPWSGGEAPKNLVSKREYRGVNVLLLGTAPYASPWWVSYKQAQELGGHVKQGQKAHLAVFWKSWDVVKSDDAGEQKIEHIPLLRYYNVFNVEQCEGIKAPEVKRVENPFTPVEQAEHIISAMPMAPEIRHEEPHAFYRPSEDFVNMPKRETFENPEEYYSTLFHELTHSTGHEKRLNRRTLADVAPFGSATYSREELVAEMGAAFLCGHVGIENKTLENSAAYLDGWRRVLKADIKAVVVAAAQAQKTADFILGKRNESEAPLEG